MPLRCPTAEMNGQARRLPLVRGLWSHGVCGAGPHPFTHPSPWGLGGRHSPRFPMTSSGERQPGRVCRDGCSAKRAAGRAPRAPRSVCEPSSPWNLPGTRWDCWAAVNAAERSSVRTKDNRFLHVCGSEFLPRSCIRSSILPPPTIKSPSPDWGVRDADVTALDKLVVTMLSWIPGRGQSR